MKVIKRVLNIVIGLVLAVSFFVTGAYGVGAENTESYALAMDTQGYVDTLGFRDFLLSDYPVAFFCGDQEYVFEGEQVTSRRPVLGSLVGTAYEVDGQYQVFVPDITDMRQTLAVVGATRGVQATYEVSDHAATIWHEAFHAWQFTHYGENFNALAERMATDDATSAQVMDALDQNTAYAGWFAQEQTLLERALHCTGDERTGYLSQWAQDVDKQRQALSTQEQNLIDYYELIEGSAYYVEGKIFLEIEGEIAYTQKYRAQDIDYVAGSTKYYESGSRKLLLLDALVPGWQASFDGNTSPTALLLAAME